MNSGGAGNVRIPSQCAGLAFIISAYITTAMKHTQRLLVEEGDLTTVANRQHPAKAVARDTVDGTVECIRPNFMA